jgi:hypothetical protein
VLSIEEQTPAREAAAEGRADGIRIAVGDRRTREEPEPFAIGPPVEDVDALVGSRLDLEVLPEVPEDVPRVPLERNPEAVLAHEAAPEVDERVVEAVLPREHHAARKAAPLVLGTNGARPDQAVVERVEASGRRGVVGGVDRARHHEVVRVHPDDSAADGAVGIDQGGDRGGEEAVAHELGVPAAAGEFVRVTPERGELAEEQAQ